MQRGSANRTTNLIRKSVATPNNNGASGGNAAASANQRPGSTRPKSTSSHHQQQTYNHNNSTTAQQAAASSGSQKRQFFLTAGAGGGRGANSASSSSQHDHNKSYEASQTATGGPAKKTLNQIQLLGGSADGANGQQMLQQFYTGRPPVSPSSRSPHRLPSQDRHKVPPQEHHYSSQKEPRLAEQLQQFSHQKSHHPLSHQGSSQGGEQRQRAMGQQTFHSQVLNQQQQQHPDNKRVTHHEALAGVNNTNNINIDELTIDIANLHRDVKAQKQSFIIDQSTSARASEARKHHHQQQQQQQNTNINAPTVFHKRQDSSNVHLQLDIEHGTIRRQQPTERQQHHAHQTQQQQQQSLSSSWARSHHQQTYDEQKPTINAVMSSQSSILENKQQQFKDKKLPLSPKTHTKADVERQTSVNHNLLKRKAVATANRSSHHHQSNNTTGKQQEPPTTTAMQQLLLRGSNHGNQQQHQQQPQQPVGQNYHSSSSIDKTELKISMPNATNNLTSVQGAAALHPNATQLNDQHQQHQRLVAGNQRYTTPNEQQQQQSQQYLVQAQPYEIARSQTNQPPKSQTQTNPSHGHSQGGGDGKRRKGAATAAGAFESHQSLAKQGGAQQASGSVRSQARGQPSSRLAGASSSSQNVGLSISRSGSTNLHQHHHHGNSHGESKSITRQQQQQMQEKKQQPSNTLYRSQTATDNSNGRVGMGGGGTGKKSGQAVRNRSIQQQVAEVVEHERRLTAVFDQKLQAQESKFMTLLEKVVESNESVKQQMQREIDRLQSQVHHLEEQLDSILPLATIGELQQHAHELHHHKQSTQTDHTEIREGVQNLQCLQTEDDMIEDVVHPLMSNVEQQLPQMINWKKVPQKPQGVSDLVLNSDNYMLIQGASACSPISQLDGIDYGKVLSTRGDKTFINELTSGPKTNTRSNHRLQEDGEGHLNNNNVISPMQKLNLSVLSSSEQEHNNNNNMMMVSNHHNNNQESDAMRTMMSKREEEFIQRLNRLKQQDDQQQMITSHRLGGSLNDISEQLAGKGPPKFIDHIDKQMSAVSRNNHHYMVAQSDTAPEKMQSNGNNQRGGGGQDDSSMFLNQIASGEITGRSENVEDTHRSSMIDQRHIEQKSLRAVSRGLNENDVDDDGQLNGEDLVNDDLNAASNEQHQQEMQQQFQSHDASRQKYQSIRDKRTHSLHHSRDNSFLSTYNASLIGMNTSMHNIAGQGNRNLNSSNNMYGSGVGVLGYMTSPTADQVQSQRQGGFYKSQTGGVGYKQQATVNSVHAARDQMMIIMNDDEEDQRNNGRILTKQIISPMSRSGFQLRYGQEQTVQLANCQQKTTSQVEPRQSYIVQDDDEQRGADDDRRVTQKINSRSASQHFSMNAGDGGNEVTKVGAGRGEATGGAAGHLHQDNLILDWSSPSQVKTVRQTHTSIVQQSRRVDLCKSLGPPIQQQMDYLLYAGSQNHTNNNSSSQHQSGFLNPLNQQKCTCMRPNNLFSGPNNQSLFSRAPPPQQLDTASAAANARKDQNQEQLPHLQSYMSARVSISQDDRLGSRKLSLTQQHQHEQQQQQQQNNYNSSQQPLHKVVSHERLDSARNEGEMINTQTEGVLETVADEDAPLKNTNNGSSMIGAGIMQSQLNQDAAAVNQDDHLKLTEVDQVMPVIPPSGFRTNPIPSQLLTKNQGYENLLLGSSQPCGEWCHWLTAEAQRQIIRGILTSTQGNTVLKASNGRPGEKRFLVNSVWWRKWCDYVNFDLVEVEQPSKQQAHLKRQRQNSLSASRHRHSAKKSNTIAEEESSFYSGSESQKNHNNTTIQSHVSSSSQQNQQVANQSSDGQTTAEDTSAKAAQQSSQTSATAAKREPPHSVPKANFMDELMSLKKQSKSIGRSQVNVTLDISKDSCSVSKLVDQSAASLSIDKNRLKSPVAGIDTQGFTEVENTLEDEIEIDETRRGDGQQNQQSLARMVPSIKNSGVTMRTSNNLNLYSRPGPVENHDLLQKRNCLLLKNNLIEHHNYVALPPLIWKHIYSWYSADWSIVRFLRRDTAQGVILDLYPLHEGGMERHETTNLDTDGEGALATVQ